MESLTGEAVWDWGLEFIRWVQTWRGPVPDVAMWLVTALGSEEFYLLVGGYLIWFSDRSLGLRLAGYALLSGWCNSELKNVFQHPRPFVFDGALQLVFTQGYGLPSGHAQNAVVVWGHLGRKMGGRKGGLVMVLLPLLIGFSRVYLGVHFPTDVLAGWLVGAVLLVAISSLERRTGLWWEELAPNRLLIGSLVAPVLLTAVFAGDSSARILGTLSGLVSGEAIRRANRAAAEGSPPFVLGLVIGLLGMGLLWSAIRLLLPALVANEPGNLRLMLFATGWLLGLWISLAAPWLLPRLRDKKP